MTNEELTGRTRYRTHRHHGQNLLVLQVEVRFLSTTWSAGVVESEWVVAWRDARVEDISTEWERSEVRLRYDKTG